MFRYQSAKPLRKTNDEGAYPKDPNNIKSVYKDYRDFKQNK